ncbi:MAG: hypothetical protein NC218_07040 [Acetobacter sp.]|nr:hypothetical protein [Acetobacter sp.]
MEGICISEKKWGPIFAALYLMEDNNIVVSGTFQDEDEKNYPGPCYEISEIPEELLAIKEERPGRYLHSPKWRAYIASIWEIVQDNPWFRY